MTVILFFQSIFLSGILKKEAYRGKLFYPLCTGRFLYEPGYSQHRNSYDSFELMYVSRGSMLLDTCGHVQTVQHF